MSGQTFVEKALARAAGVASARAGDVLIVRPDCVLSHDNTAAIARIFSEIGLPLALDPDRMVITLDHAAPAPTTAHARNHAEIRAFVRDHGIRHFFEIGRGICHQVISEEALILPGEVIFGSDSHTTHFGWLGAFGMGVGRTEMAALWATGSLWIRVPETLRVLLNGRLRPGVTAKDAALRLCADLTVSGGAYRAIEFAGEGIASLPFDDLPVLPNMMAEFGAMSACIAPDERVLAYLEAKRTRDYTPLYPDADAVYDQTHIIDLDALEPLIALPGAPDRVVPLSQAAGTPIDQAFIGTCTGGRYDDLAAAAAVVRGKQVRSRLIVIPASRDVLLRAAQTGVLADLVAAGAAISTPGCGPCMGNHQGVPAVGEASIISGSRNFHGRMGTPDAPIYLANPAVVAAAAVAGAIVPVESVMEVEA
jgi:3-isopropylmalate/(R)-2-methylmalate dehydratase large subunit